MAEPPDPQVTQLLLAWGEGKREALDVLIPMVYEELRRLAHRYMAGERRGHTLQTTALVNEAYLRLVDVGKVQWENRAHFFALSAQLMRRILVEFARARGSEKRGGGVRKVPLDEAMIGPPEPGQDLVALDDALTAMAAVDPRQAQVVELRFFGGLTVEETAEALHVSPQTVLRDWKLAKAWLRREMRKTISSQD